MQIETLAQIKQQITLLDNESKRNLADFLAREIAPKSETVSASASEEERQNQLEWLKHNREKYAGKYVALSGGEMVGEEKLCAKPAKKQKREAFKILL